MEKTLLKLENARVGFSGKTLLGDVSIEVRAQQRILLTGPNGSGKTTLGKTLLGVQPLLEGTRKSSHGTFAFVPQESALDEQYPLNLEALVRTGMSEYLMPFYKKMGKVFSATQKEKVYAALRRVGLESKGHLSFARASGGELQRALLARAIVSSPAFILMDEPFSSIDKAGRADIAATITEYQKESGAAIVVIDHFGVMSESFYTDHWEISANKLNEIK